jgi:hypothetical protein
MTEIDDLRQKTKELMDLVESQKDFLKLVFDHFKNLTAIGSTALVLSFGLHSLVLVNFASWQKICFLISLLLFLGVIIMSLSAMTDAGNMVIYCNEIQVSARATDVQGVNNSSDKIIKTLKKIGILDKATRYFYISGMSILVVITATLILFKWGEAWGPGPVKWRLAALAVPCSKRRS